MHVLIEEIVADELVGQPLDEFLELLQSFERETAPDDPDLRPGWVKARFNTTRPSYPQQHVVARVDGQLVGFAEIEFTRTGVNEELVVMEIRVRPEHRRQGVGTALYEEGVRRSVAEGSTSLVSWCLDSPATQGFWTAKGAEKKYDERSSRLHLDRVDRSLIQRWKDAAQPARDEGYVLRSWRGVCPDDMLEPLLAVLVGMHDAPLDDLDMDHEIFTEQTVRDRENRWTQAGSEMWQMLILDPEGAPAALTELVIHSSRPDLIWQEGTTTLPAYRRRGLGRWVKAEMLEQVLDELPEARCIETENAESNSSMLNLNVEMGFAPHLQYAAFQMDLPAAEAG